MTLGIKSITFDCQDWVPMVDFWSRAVGFTEDPDNPNTPGDPEGLPVSPDGTHLLFIPVPEAKSAKNRVHLDLAPTEGTRDEEVHRLVELGAMLVDDQRGPDGAGWVVLSDPEGNEFCVVRSDAERAG